MNFSVVLLLVVIEYLKEAARERKVAPIRLVVKNKSASLCATNETPLPVPLFLNALGRVGIPVVYFTFVLVYFGYTVTNRRVM